MAVSEKTIQALVDAGVLHENEHPYVPGVSLAINMDDCINNFTNRLASELSEYQELLKPANEFVKNSTALRMFIPCSDLEPSGRFWTRKNGD